MGNQPQRRTKGTGSVSERDGNFRGQYVGPDGKRRSKTFHTKTEALTWLATMQTDVVRQDWRPPEPGKQTVASYVGRWVEDRPVKESTRSLYRDLHRLWITPYLDMPLSRLDPATVRSWHVAITKATGPTRVAQTYRLLRAALNTAVEDEILKTNPCRIRGAGQSAEAPVRAVVPGEVSALADAVPHRYSALVLLLAWGGLRPGEAFALTADDLDGNRVTVSRRTYRHHDGVVSVEAPKTRAGLRTVSLPPDVAEALHEHARTYPGPLLFTTSSGRPLERRQWHGIVTRAANRAGIERLRPYDLRAAGATFAVQHGATTREVMARLGQVSPDAALRYQRAAEDRDSALAEAMNEVIREQKNVVPLRRRTAR